jgi:flagellin-like hook-associated protein FlgL
MSGITLSASVRQNLLSLQSTASLLATTQNDLATGNKVNSALDNPTSFFTAQGLNNRASDINNLLDQIGNGVQVLQAANTGITSLQSLVSSAQSIANQVLQAPTGYATKSSVSSSAITGATAENLLGSGGNGTVTGTALTTDQTGGTAPAISASTTLVGTAGSTSDDLGTSITAGSVLNVNGKTITFSSTATAASATDANGNVTISIKAGSTASVGTVLSAIDSITGATTASTVTSGGALQLSTGTAQPLTISGGTGNALAALGLTAGTTPNSALDGETLTIPATLTGGSATTLTFGTGSGQISTLNGLNTALASSDLQASIDSSGVLSITTTNNAASLTLGGGAALTGTAVGTGGIFATGAAAAAPVADPNSQATRASLVAQYNQVIQNITTTAQDSSFNGINLLNGDTLNLTFDETGASKLSVTGVTFNATGLGLSSLTQGTDFLDNNSANTVLTTLTQASTTLRTEASALGSNLSVVQIRQDFNKNLINVLQTGASNLTLADTNEEAANSQALSTRQSIAVSALALANSSQQSVLQLLR